MFLFLDANKSRFSHHSERRRDSPLSSSGAGSNAPSFRNQMEVKRDVIPFFSEALASWRAMEGAQEKAGLFHRIPSHPIPFHAIAKTLPYQMEPRLLVSPCSWEKTVRLDRPYTVVHCRNGHHSSCTVEMKYAGSLGCSYS